MTVKRIYKIGLEKISNSKMGPFVQEFLRGSSEIVDNIVGRQFRNDMNVRLAVSNVVSNDNPNAVLSHCYHGETSNNERIKVRVFHCSDSTFNVVQSVCECFRDDPKYELLIVLFGNLYAGMIAQMETLGYNYTADYNYSLKDDKPDISIIYHSEMIYPPQLTHIREFSKFVALVPLSIGSIWFGDRTVSRLNLDRFNADMVCVGNLCYERLKRPIGEEKVFKISPAQFDLAFRKFREPKIYPEGWGKLKGKKVVMLMTDHGLKKNLVSDEVTFDLYFQDLMKYFKEHPDMGLIIRLHFALIHELVSTFWSLNDYRLFINYCKNSPNIVWDETSDYLTGLHIADASIVDVNCSLVYYTLSANKPIAVPYRYDMPVDVNNPELVKDYYAIRSKDELVHYLDMIRASDDPLADLRQEAFDKYIVTFDGLNGARIAKEIETRYLRMISNK